MSRRKLIGQDQPRHRAEVRSADIGFRIRTQLAFFLATGAMLVLALTAVFASGRSTPDPNPGPGPTGPGAPADDQFAYQAEVLDARRSLFEGDLFVQTDRQEMVATWFPVTLIICGQANTDDPCVYPQEEPGPVTPTGSRIPSTPAKTVKIGGLVGVSLSSTELDIRSGSTDSAAYMPLVSPTDRATWLWDVRADEPGIYLLRFVISLVAVDKETHLVPTETVTVRVTVKQSSSDAARVFGATAAKAVNWSLEMVIALGGAGLITAAGLAGGYRWLRRRRPDGADEGSSPAKARRRPPHRGRRRDR